MHENKLFVISMTTQFLIFVVHRFTVGIKDHDLSLRKNGNS